MITEDYCSFEVSKLLKEKGFNESCYTYYDDINNSINRFNKGYCFNNTSYPWGVPYDVSKSKKYIIAPTHQIAIKWLREVYHIEINITFGFPFIDGKQQYKYFWSIVRVCDNHLEYPMDNPNSVFYNEEMSNSYEECIEAALKYILENLI